MNSKKIIAAAVVLMLLMITVVLAVPCSSASEYEKEETDVTFSRATVTYLTDVHYTEHKDRTGCWFFIPGSANEKTFRDYVTQISATVPTADDRNELNTLSSPLCNIYSVDLKPRFTDNAPLVVTGTVVLHADKGDHVYVRMNAGYGTYFHIVSSNSDQVQTWANDSQYTTKATESTDYTILPYNESLFGGAIDLSHLFVKVSYSVKVTAATPSYGDNVSLVIVFFVIAAGAIALIVYSSKKISWAKGAEEPEASIDEEQSDGEHKTE